MKRPQRVLFRLLHPGALCGFFLALASAAALAYVFVNRLENTALAYACYALSAYTLAVLGMGVPHMVRRAKAAVYANQYGNRYFSDIAYRTKLSLYLALGVNLLYSAVKLMTGILYASFWFASVAVYYMVLSVARFLLLRQLRSGQQDMKKAFLEYRFCGGLLLALNIALIGMVILMVADGKSYEYPGFLIYAAAAYAFYSLTVAIISAVRFRRLNDPILSAAKAINLTTALVSILSLQTAMFAAFGTENVDPRLFNALTGGGVCLIISGMAAFMILRANKALAEMKNSGALVLGTRPKRKNKQPGTE